MIKKFIFLFLFLFLFSIVAFAQDSHGPPLTVEEVDGSPSVSLPWKIIFDNDSLTDNVDGTVTHTIGGLSPTFGTITASSVITNTIDSLTDGTHFKIYPTPDAGSRYVTVFEDGGTNTNLYFRLYGYRTLATAGQKYVDFRISTRGILTVDGSINSIDIDENVYFGGYANARVISTSGGVMDIRTENASDPLSIQGTAANDLNIFTGAGTYNTNRYVYIYGDDGGSGQYGRIRVNTSGDFEFEAESGTIVFLGDIDSSDSTPHYKWIDSDTGQDDYEAWVDDSQWYLYNLTDEVQLLKFNEANEMIIPRKLTVITDDNETVTFEDRAGGPGFLLTNAFHAAFFGLSGDYNAEFINQGSGYLQLGTDDSTDIWIKTGGYVGIGGTDPTHQLDVVGDISMSQWLHHNDDADTRIGFDGADTFKVVVGNEEMINIVEDDSQDIVEIGDDGDVDVKLSAGIDGALTMEGSTGNALLAGDLIQSQATPSYTYFDTDTNTGFIEHIDMGDTSGRLYALYLIDSSKNINATYRKPIWYADSSANFHIPYSSVFHEVLAPANPGADRIRIYAKDDEGDTILYAKDSAGNEYDLTGGGTPGATTLDALTDCTVSAYTAGHVLRANGSIFVNAQLSHTDLADIGSNAHSVIDTHIANTSNPHTVTVAQIGAVATTGNESVGGVKTFTSIPVLPASDPTTDNQAARKAYVDTVALGLQVKASCEVASVGNVDESQELEADDTIDGYTLVEGDRVLLKDQTDATENGIWVAVANGAGAASRATDYDASSEVQEGTFTSIIGGDTHANQQWVQVTIDPTLGTDNLVFSQLSAQQVYTAGDGMDVAALEFSVDLKANDGLKILATELTIAYDNSSIGIVSNELAVKASGITNAMLAGSIADSNLATISTVNKVAWAAVNKTGSVINDIGDVNAPAPTDNQSLTWDDATSKWVPETITGAGGANAAVMDVDVVNYVTLWRNMPAAETELFANTENRVKVDLTYATHYRIVVNQTVAGQSGADFNLQYSTDNNSYQAADSAAAGEVDVGTGTGVKVGSWAELVAGAKADVWLMIVGKQGSTADPRWKQIRLQFKVLSTAGEAPANAEYVVLTANATLSDERVLTGTANQITITDGGAGSNATLSIPEDVLYTGTSPSNIFFDTDTNTGFIQHVDMGDTSGRLYALYLIDSNKDINATYRKPVYYADSSAQFHIPYGLGSALGIGTAPQPGIILHMKGASGIETQIQSDSTAASSTASYGFRQSTADSNVNTALIKATRTNDPNSGDGTITIMPANNHSPTTVATFDGHTKYTTLAGPVGIGCDAGTRSLTILQGSDNDLITFIRGADLTEYIAHGVGTGYAIITAGHHGSGDCELRFNTSDTSEGLGMTLSKGKNLTVVGSIGAGGATATAGTELWMADSNDVSTLIGERTDTSVSSGQDIFEIAAYGGEDGGEVAVAKIVFEAAGTWNADDSPTRIKFFVAPDGSETPAEEFEIDEDEISITNSTVFTRGVYTVATVVEHDSSSPVTLATVDDGYAVLDVYADVTQTWDGNGTVTIGDGNDVDGFASNADLDTGTTGWKCMSGDTRGDYISVVVPTADPMERYVYSSSDTIDATVVTGTSTQGRMTIYITIEKLK